MNVHASKLSTIVLHFMRIVYKKFRQVPNFRSCRFPPICFLPNLWRHISNIVFELNIFADFFFISEKAIDKFLIKPGVSLPF